MTRRRIIIATLAALLMAFVIAVQHDTFVRRWCLPAPSPATRPIGRLDQVIDAFVVDDTECDWGLRELERRSGIRVGSGQVELDYIPALLAEIATDPRGRRPACTIQGATVEQLLSRIFAPVMPLNGWSDPFALDADGRVKLFSRKAGGRQTVVRVHGLDPAVMQPNLQWMGFPWIWGFIAREPIQRAALLTSDVTNQGIQFDPVVRFGDKLIVLTTPRGHWLIDQLLREEVEAQKAAHRKPGN